MLETCDKESIVYINCGDDINSIDEIYYMLYVKLALIELALFNLMISLEPLRVLRTLRYTPRRGWNGGCASNISIVINNNDYID